MNRLSSLCVFLGSRPGRDPAYLEAARELGGLMAARGVALVYGGASVGLMGALADAVLAHGGQAVGVIPGFMRAKEIAHAGLSKLVVVDSMHERKAQMAALADAFIAMPGGMGTLEEFCEVLTWNQLGLHRKPCGLLNTGGYHDSLIAFLDTMRGQGFLGPDHRESILTATTPAPLLDLIDARFSSPTPRDRLDRT